MPRVVSTPQVVDGVAVSAVVYVRPAPLSRMAPKWIGAHTWAPCVACGVDTNRYENGEPRHSSCPAAVG